MIWSFRSPGVITPFVSVALLLAVAQPQLALAQATLPTSFSGPGWQSGLPAGWSQTGMGGDYTGNYDGAGGAAGKFDNTGDTMTIQVASDPGTVRYYLGGNSLSGAYVFDVDESVDGTAYTSVRSFAGSGIVASPGSAFTNTLNAASRYIRFKYTTKATGNVGIDGVLIATAAPTSNQPPSFVSIADFSAPINSDITFLVQAGNIDPTDEMTLWATNLPAGATFEATNGIGSASSTFNWIGATPGGSYPVTFYAADKDGTNTESVTITVVDPSNPTEPIISEYGEGASNNKYIELFNPTGDNIDLSAYSLRKQVNGAGIFGSTLALSGSLSPGQTYVIVYTGGNPATAANLLSLADLAANSSALTFNGNDAVALYKGEDRLDVVGVADDPANWGQDTILIRKSTVSLPKTIYDPADWDATRSTTYEAAFWPDVGNHTYAYSADTPPQLTVPSPVVITYLGAPISFAVSASDVNDGDEITLSASALPSGSTFPTVVANTSASSTFTWTNPSPAGGPYNAVFRAVDKDGTNSQTVAITVYPAMPTNQSLVVHINEVRANDAATDDAEFVELIGRAGVDLAGCTLVHYSGTAGSDGGVWTFTFPATTNSIIPDEGIVDTNGFPCGFIVLAQPGGAVAGSADLLLPVDPASTNIPAAALQNDEDGLVLYDPSNNVLDAVAWGAFGNQSASGDLLADDPGPGKVSRSIPTTWPDYLHAIPYSSDDNCPQAPDDVIGSSGISWQSLAASPGAINNTPHQSNGLVVLAPQIPPPPLPPTGLVLMIW